MNTLRPIELWDVHTTQHLLVYQSTELFSMLENVFKYLWNHFSRWHDDIQSIRRAKCNSTQEAIKFSLCFFKRADHLPANDGIWVFCETIENYWSIRSFCAFSVSHMWMRAFEHLSYTQTNGTHFQFEFKKLQIIFLNFHINTITYVVCESARVRLCAIVCACVSVFGASN